MSYFIDTNISIGYTVVNDKWHEKAVKFICESDEEMFWSNLVQQEYSKKLSEIIYDVETFLKRSKLLLKNNETSFTNYEEFEDFIINKTKNISLDRTKKIKILETFWNKFNFYYEVPKTIYKKFNEYYAGFQNVYFARNKELKNLIKLHNCGLDNYLKYYVYGKQLQEWGVHSPDCKILTDAHDCGFEQNNLIFVTTDEELINKILKHDYSFLNIIEFKSCN